MSSVKNCVNENGFLRHRWSNSRGDVNAPQFEKPVGETFSTYAEMREKQVS